MQRRVATLVLALMLANAASSQVLFSYGKYKVDKQEFLKAFNKNPSLEPDRKKALREYLDLYINFKLKVQAALDAKLDREQSYQYEAENFRKQLATNFINEEANIRALVEEAFRRSRKDVHLQQVFIEFGNPADTLAAYKKAQQAWSELRTGKPFSEVVGRYATPSSSELGWITVFSLPYQYENIIYQLGAGQFSAPVRTASGYHIFYHAGERPAAGRRKAAQILFAVPPSASSQEKEAIRLKADSVRKVILQHPAKFDEMVHLFSNDLSTADNHGLMQEFGIGEFSPEFEAAVFALKTPGEITQPVETQYGYHLVQLKEIIPVAKDLEDPVAAASLREKVEKDDRLSQARKLLVDKWMKLAKYQPAVYDEQHLWAYTDSFFNGAKPAPFSKVNDSTVIFRFSKQKITASDFAKYNRAVKAYPMYQAMSYPEIMKEYARAATTEYYQDQLEDYNPDFRAQLKEFNDANLLFAVMDKEIWTRSATDEAGLKAFYEKNRQKYTWEASANAILFTARNESVLNSLLQQLAGNVASWKEAADRFGNDVMADSNRFELSQIPVAGRTNFTNGLLTAPVKNNDGSYSFAYIVKVMMEPGQRSFEEARGMVINDYQKVLEEEWLASLKKKYPVKVNEGVFRGIE